jgi:hypothetical protein
MLVPAVRVAPRHAEQGAEQVGAGKHQTCQVEPGRWAPAVDQPRGRERQQDRHGQAGAAGYWLANLALHDVLERGQVGGHGGGIATDIGLVTWPIGESAGDHGFIRDAGLLR